MSDLGGTGERLRHVRDELDLSQAQMAKRVGLSSYMSWQQYELGKTLPSARVLFELARLGWEPRWVISGGGPRRVGETIGVEEPPPVYKTDPIGNEFVLLPRVAARPSAGYGALVESEQVVDHLAFKTEWLDREIGIPHERLILVNAVGDSMAETINDGDLLLVDVGDQNAARAGIFILALGEDLVVKRVTRSLTEDAIILASDNPAYGAQTVRKEDASPLRIVGRVIWAGGRI